MSVFKPLAIATAVVLGLSSVASAATARQAQHRAPAQSKVFYLNDTSGAYTGVSGNTNAAENFQDQFNVSY